MEATPSAWLRMPARADRRAGLRLKKPTAGRACG